MAINPETQYPGKIAPSSANYPYGEARNITVPGDGKGTPWEAAIVNDLLGFQQAMLSAANVVPSGDPDTAPLSQYLEALNKITVSNALTFDSVVSLVAGNALKGISVDFDKLASVNASVRTISYHTGWAAQNRDPIGGARYTVVTPAEYATMPQKNGDVALSGGNVAVLEVTDSTAIVTQYGAKGDGVTNDTVAAQNAHDDFDTVFFPKLSTGYSITNIILNDRAIFRSNGAELLGTTTGSMLGIADPVGASADHIEITGFTLTSTVASSGVAINIGTNVRRVYIRYNRIRSFNKGVQLEGAYSSDVSFNEIRNNTTGVEILSGCHAITLINNLCNQNTVRGLSITGTMRNVTIVGGAYQASQIGIFADGVESLTILGDVYYEINSIADVKLVNCYTPKIFSGNSSSPVSEASVVLEDCAGNCRVQGMTFAAGTSGTPAHIKVAGVNGVTVIEDMTAAAGHANPIDTASATNAKNVSVGSGSVYAMNATNKATKYKVTLEGEDEWTKELTNIGTPSGRVTLQQTSTTGRDYRISTDGVYRLERESTSAEIYSVNMSAVTPTFQQSGHFQPFAASSGIPNLGGAANEWNTLFATTPPVISSDVRLKQDVRPLDDAEKAVANKLRESLKMYKLKAAVKLKGEDGARLHCGIIAQDVVSIFESEGLDAMDYALLCYDEWEDEFEDVIERDSEGGAVLDENNEPVVIDTKLVLAAGNQYAVRYEELLAFVVASL